MEFPIYIYINTSPGIMINNDIVCPEVMIILMISLG